MLLGVLVLARRYSVNSVNNGLKALASTYRNIIVSDESFDMNMQ